ncbi:hypothetical protein CPB86DRAFT_781659 [Serendipita vermifera]|nr:hypothetical protein CPB86DRAFT_781659 [Serendipita vermifera]
MSVRSALGHSKFEFFVNTLSLRLDRKSVVSGSVVYCQPSTQHWAGCPSRCSCDDLDDTLEKTLSSLVNLKALRLNCCLCETKLYDKPWSKRHQYFATLQTKVLQEVRFSCSCSFMDQKKLEEYFGAPCMATVTTLRWCTRGLYITPGYLKTSFSDPTILPNLQNLQYEGSRLDDILLRSRPIRRISSTNYRGEMAPKYQDLIDKRRGLTHISIRHSDTSRTLIGAIGENPLSFRHLQHLGVFQLPRVTCLEQSEELYATLSRLAGLEQLVSVEAIPSLNCTKCGKYISDFCSGLDQLPSLFPNLCRIYLLHNDYWKSGTCDIWMFSKTWGLEVRDHSMRDELRVIWDIPISSQD